MIKKTLAIMALSSLAMCTTAAEFGGKIKALLADSHGRILFNIESGSAQPACAPALWQFSFSLSHVSAKEWFSMLLTTRATGTTIMIGYAENPAGECAVVYMYYLD